MLCGVSIVEACRDRVHLSESLLDLIVSGSLVRSCLDFLCDYEASGFAEAVTTAEEIARKLGAGEHLSSSNRGPIREQKELAEAFEADFFTPLMKTTRALLRERFKFLEPHKRAGGFLYYIGDLPIDVLAQCKKLEVLLIYCQDSNPDRIELCEEFKQISLMIPSDRI